MNTTGTPVAGEAPLFAVCYDISCDRERRRADKLLKGYGFRRQKSVFECHLTLAQKQNLHAALERLNLKTGHVRMYRIQALTQPKVFGLEPEAGADEAFSYGV